MRLRNHKTKTVTVTQNLVHELKYDTVNNKNDNTLPGQAGHRSSPARLSKLPALGSQAVLIVIPWGWKEEHDTGSIF